MSVEAKCYIRTSEREALADLGYDQEQVDYYEKVFSHLKGVAEKGQFVAWGQDSRATGLAVVFDLRNGQQLRFILRSGNTELLSLAPEGGKLVENIVVNFNGRLTLPSSELQETQEIIASETVAVRIIPQGVLLLKGRA